MDRRLVPIGVMILLVLAFFGVNIVAQSALRPLRIDLTEGNLYSLSDSAKKIASGLSDPVRLTLYFSESVARGDPQMQMHGARVKDVLSAFARASKGKVTLSIVDPEPFSEAEDKAVAAGIPGVPAGGGRTMYFGLIGTNAIDGKETIPFFSPTNERFLEYDITKLIYALAHPEKPVVGLISGLPINGGFALDPQTRQPRQTPAWAIVRAVGQAFELKDLGASPTDIPDDVDVLWVVHPKNIPETTQFAIDQFVMKGKPMLACVDPLCESDQPIGGDQMQAMMHQRGSDLNALLEVWGVTMDAVHVAGDETFGIRLQMQQGGEELTVLYYLSLTKEAMNRADPAVGMLSGITLGTAGFFKPKPVSEGAASATIEPLLFTTTEAGLISVAELQFQANPMEILRNFQPGTERLTLAARLRAPAGGQLRSAFPGGRPAAPTAPTPDDSQGDQLLEPPAATQPTVGVDAVPAPVAPATPSTPSLTESSGPLNIIVIGDCDMLHDRFWITPDQRLGNIVLPGRKMADNGDLIVGILDNLRGGSELASIRARGEFSRPFTKMQAIQKDAEKKYLAQQQALEADLQATEAKLTELQKQRPEGDTGALLSEAQAKEVEQFEKNMLDTRQQLRKVRLDLRKDIEKLQSNLRLINMGLIPLLVAAGAVGVGLFRTSRRNAGRKAG